MSELEFMRRLMLALGRRRDLRIWRQNVGRIQIRDDKGRLQRVFMAGPPPGAADLSGIAIPDGWRLEIEVKSARGRQSPAQKRWAEFIEQSGGVYVLVQLDPRLAMQDNVHQAVDAVDAALLARRVSG